MWIVKQEIENKRNLFKKIKDLRPNMLTTPVANKQPL